MRLRFLIIFFISAAIGCSSPSPQESASDTLVVADSLTSDSVLTDRVQKEFEGLYTFGDEMSTFRTCNGAKIYWLIDSSGKMSDAYKSASKFLHYPYESQYVQVKGYLLGKSELGYASEYENVLVVQELIKLEPKNNKTECYDYEFIALGAEPFWSLDIIPSEDLIVFKDAGNEKVYLFPYSKSLNSNGQFQYKTVNSANDQLTITFRKQTCSDGMSDRVYDYGADINLNGQDYRGCGIKKEQSL